MPENHCLNLNVPVNFLLLPTPFFFFSSPSNQQQWVEAIRRSLYDHDQEAENHETPVAIFTVPKSFISSSSHLHSFFPKQVSIGPYHYSRLDLQQMERYKLFAAKRVHRQLQLQDRNFQLLVDRWMDLEPRIRASYHQLLNFRGETLAWMMGLDASFLFLFLQTYSGRGNENDEKIPSRLAHLIDYSMRKSAHNAILRDLVMLENQIPIFVLKLVVELQFPSHESAEDVLIPMLRGLCKELCPFKRMVIWAHPKMSDHAHLLDLVYNVVVPKVKEEAILVQETEDFDEELKSQTETIMENEGYLKKIRNGILNPLPNLINFLAKVTFFKKLVVPFTVILKFPWKMLCNLPGFSVLKRPVSILEQENESNGTDSSESPLVQDITIPSATQLANSGIRFFPTEDNISSIHFDSNTATFYLPCITLHVNSEVLLRNLVAYEVSRGEGSMVFTRYAQLMSGIMEGEEDVRLLRETGVVMNRMQSDEQVVEMWDGLNECVKLRKVPWMDKVIEDVNGYYNGRLKIRVGNLMKQHVLGSWQFLTFLATILFLLLTAFDSFCSAFDCIEMFHINTSS